MKTSPLATIAVHLGLSIPADQIGIGDAWPILEKMRSDGAVVVVKLDGERVGPDDTGPYTVLVSGAHLGGVIRSDAFTIEAALTDVICQYASKAWGLPRLT